MGSHRALINILTVKLNSYRLAARLDPTDVWLSRMDDACSMIEQIRLSLGDPEEIAFRNQNTEHGR